MSLALLTTTLIAIKAGKFSTFSRHSQLLKYYLLTPTLLQNLISFHH